MKKWILGVVVIVVVLIAWAVWDSKKPGELDAFAQCLDEKGLTYYGAFWCPNCKIQNDMFGRSKKYVPYVECSTPDGKRQTQECIDAGVKAYPTWAYPNGERAEGTQPLQTLAERSGCALPQ